jgi:ABC-type nitrate/sulfonate/bicarbonate transport system substrate-binding protein
MLDLKIGGVPEHFNLPWYHTLKNKEYTKEGINLRWKDFYGGTGQMSDALRNKEIDLAVILTEGMVREIINGNACKIVQVFIKSPLIWGIHVAENSDYTQVSDLKGKKAAISRYGSGSHLMAYVNAEKQKWNLEKDLDFEVIKNLAGAVENLPKGIGDYFLWEKFTTKPLVDNHTFRLVGECPTPWSCFVIAVRNEVLEQESEAINSILKIINRTTKNFKDYPNIDQEIAKRYHQKVTDVREWLSLTQWSQAQISENELSKVQDKLIQLQLIKYKVPYQSLIW